MGLQQLKSGDKVRLQLIQPQFKCSGRDDVTCKYRGKIINNVGHFLVVEFKYKGERVTEKYYLPEKGVEGFTKEELQDIKITGS